MYQIIEFSTTLFEEINKKTAIFIFLVDYEGFTMNEHRKISMEELIAFESEIHVESNDRTDSSNEKKEKEESIEKKMNIIVV